MKSSRVSQVRAGAALDLRTLGCKMVQGANLSEATGFHSCRAVLHIVYAPTATAEIRAIYFIDYRRWWTARNALCARGFGGFAELLDMGKIILISDALVLCRFGGGQSAGSKEADSHATSVRMGYFHCIFHPHGILERTNFRISPPPPPPPPYTPCPSEEEPKEVI